MKQEFIGEFIAQIYMKNVQKNVQHASFTVHDDLIKHQRIICMAPPATGLGTGPANTGLMRPPCRRTDMLLLIHAGVFKCCQNLTITWNDGRRGEERTVNRVGSSVYV